MIRIDYKNSDANHHNFQKNIKISIYVDYKNSSYEIGNQRKDGIKKNGPGWETASIFFDPSGSEILCNAFHSEFVQKGYNVLHHNLNSDIYIEIFVNQFFVEPYHEHFDMFLISVIDADVIVKINKRSYKRRFKNIKKDNSLWEINYKKSIENNLESFTSQVVLEVDDLIKIKFSKKN